MITIEKRIIIDEGDVPVFEDICAIARQWLSEVTKTAQPFAAEREKEIQKFLKIILEKV